MAERFGISIEAGIDTSQKTVDKLQRDLDKLSKRLKLNISNINLAGQELTRSTSGVASSTQKITKELSTYERALGNIIQKYKEKAIATDVFIKSANKALSMTQAQDLSDKKRVQTIKLIENAEKNLIKTKQESINLDKKRNSLNSYSSSGVSNSYKNSFGGELTNYQKYSKSSDVEANKIGSAIGNLFGESVTRNAIQLEQTTKRVKTEVSNLGSEFNKSSKHAKTFGDTLGHNISKMLEWSVAGTAIFGSLRQIQEGVKYIFELDNALNEIRIVTGQSQQEVEKLAKSYNELGKEMGVTTTEIAKTSVELYRQGLTQKEVDERMKSIIQYSKISNISLDDSNKIITATANATGEGVTKIIDIFALLGDKTA